MRELQFVSVLGIWAMLGVTSLAAADLKIVANASVKVSSISADDLKGIFLATKTTLADNSHVEPVLAKRGPAHEAFVRQYIGKTESALETYYRSLVFTGKGSMPKALGSDAEIAAYVAKTKGAIGYVAAGMSTEGLKVIDVK